MDIYGYMRRRSATRVERKPGIGGVCASRALLRTRRLRHASALVAILADESPVSCASVSTALYSASRNVLSRRTQAALTNGSNDSMNRIAAASGRGGVSVGHRAVLRDLPRAYRYREVGVEAHQLPRVQPHGIAVPCAPAAAPVPRAAARRATPPRVPRRYPAAVPWRGFSMRSHRLPLSKRTCVPRHMRTRRERALALRLPGSDPLSRETAIKTPIPGMQARSLRR